MPDGSCSLVGRLFKACLTVFAAMLLLGLAVNILRCIWPWLAGIAAITGAMYVVIWLVQRRLERW